jgi:hypothetical protein
VTGSCEHGSEPSGFIIDRELHDKLINHQLPEKKSAVLSKN